METLEKLLKKYTHVIKQYETSDSSKHALYCKTDDNKTIALFLFYNESDVDNIYVKCNITRKEFEREWKKYMR